MSNQRVPLVNDEFYHIVYRAVGDTTIFKEESDSYRGIFCLYEFNNKDFVNIWKRRNERIAEKKRLGPTQPTLQVRDMFVEILAFCLMPNHIHLLLRQLKDNGISEFMQKVGTGYAVYFNKKYNRRGHLFSRFKAVHIKTNDQLKNVFTYIHCNPLSLIEPNWKENGIKDPQKAVKFLEEEYKWSSFFDFLGKKNFPSVTTRDFLLKVMGGSSGCRQAIRDWIIYKNGLGDFSDVSLE